MLLLNPLARSRYSFPSSDMGQGRPNGTVVPVMLQYVSPIFSLFRRPSRLAYPRSRKPPPPPSGGRITIILTPPPIHAIPSFLNLPVDKERAGQLPRRGIIQILLRSTSVAGGDAVTAVVIFSFLLGQSRTQNTHIFIVFPA